MKKSILITLLLLSLSVMVTHPGLVIQAVNDGLLLWYGHVLPSLLLFTMISSLLTATGYFYYITNLLYPLAGVLHFPYSNEGLYPLLTGFLFGFPLGSRTAAELYRQQKICKAEAQNLICVSNNLSPMFLTGYVLSESFQAEALAVPFLFAVYFPPLIFGIASACIFQKKATAGSNISKAPGAKKAVSTSKPDFGMIDAAIMSSFDTMIKLGGYIVLFSVVIRLIQSTLMPGSYMYLFVTGFLEVTNGIACLKNAMLSKNLCLSLSVFFLSFGGLSGLAQTCSMISGTDLSIFWYTVCKLALAVCSFLLFILLLQLIV